MSLRQTTLPVPVSRRESASIQVESRVINARVANLRKLGYINLQDFLDASSDHMYVGRDLSHRVKGAVKSKWRNPFTLAGNNDDLDLVISKFKEYIKKSSLYDDLPELRGKTLACWCYPAPCHARALLELLDEKERKGEIGS